MTNGQLFRAANRSSSGFTLTELLVGIVLLGLIGIAVASVSITGMLQVSDENVERQADASTAQFASIVFAGDVQGAAGLAGECAPGAGGVHLITLAGSDAAAPDVEYRRSAAAPFDLVRVECGGGTRAVARELADPPEIRCGPAAAPVACDPGTTPRVVTLQASRTESFGFELAGARRTTDGNDPGGPNEAPNFVSLSGTHPLRVGGNARLRVDGAAYLNRPTGSSNAVELFGSGAGTPGDPGSYQLAVLDGQFALQEGAGCSGCSARAWPFPPGSYSRPLPDPLRFLPEPEVTGPTRTECPIEGDQRVCRPGTYTVAFPPGPGGGGPGGGGGGVRDYVLEPGVYVLDAGMTMTASNGSIRGDDVMLFVRSGQVNLQGSEFALSPPSSGEFTGMLLYQRRTNSSTITITGNTDLAILGGTLYAPGSNGVELGAGNGSLTVGRVIGTSLSVQGNGTVTVGGS